MREMAAQGVASAAPAVLRGGLARSELAVENIHASIELRSFRPGADLKLVADANRLFDMVRRSPTGRPFVDGYLADDLFERGAMMVVAQRRRLVMGTLHYHLSDGNLLIRGVAVDPKHSGNKLASAMVALGLCHSRIVFGEVPYVECAIRVLPDSLNEPSRASFARLGFALHNETGTSHLVGNYRDRDKFESAEQDADGAKFIRWRRMSIGPEVYDVARTFLMEWSDEILPISRRRFAR